MANGKWQMANGNSARLALLGICALIALLVVISVIQTARQWVEVRRLNRTYTQLTGIEPAKAAPAAAARDEMVQRISRNRLIAPAEFQLTGVLGDQAIFNGGMVLKTGQSAGEMKILQVGPNWVEVEKSGKQQKLYVFQPMGSPGGGGGMPGRMVLPPGVQLGAPAGGAKMRRTGASPASPAPAPAGPVQIQVSSQPEDGQ
jgi:hypothetical protein